MFDNIQPTLNASDAQAIVGQAVPYCLAPNLEVVKKLNGAVFPTIRNSELRIKRDISECGKEIMYDDNTTPRWAYMWAHGDYRVAHPRNGWTFAHVWDESRDPDAYTNVANLVVMPECLASLSDGNGPLVEVLRYHAWKIYGWKPASKSLEPKKPEGFDKLKWKYIKKNPKNPRDLIYKRLCELNNQRSKILCDLM